MKFREAGVEQVANGLRRLMTPKGRDTAMANPGAIEHHFAGVAPVGMR